MALTVVGDLDAGAAIPLKTRCQAFSSAWASSSGCVSKDSCVPGTMIGSTRSRAANSAPASGRPKGRHIRHVQRVLPIVAPEETRRARSYPVRVQRHCSKQPWTRDRPVRARPRHRIPAPTMGHQGHVGKIPTFGLVDDTIHIILESQPRQIITISQTRHGERHRLVPRGSRTLSYRPPRPRPVPGVGD
jgi:hypothetical protein